MTVVAFAGQILQEMLAVFPLYEPRLHAAQDPREKPNPGAHAHDVVPMAADMLAGHAVQALLPPPPPIRPTLHGRQDELVAL